MIAEDDNVKNKENLLKLQSEISTLKEQNSGQ